MLRGSTSTAITMLSAWRDRRLEALIRLVEETTAPLIMLDVVLPGAADRIMHVATAPDAGRCR